MRAVTAIFQQAPVRAMSLVLAVSLAACSSEATERKAFIDFLQTRIIDKPGYSMPRLTPEDQKAIGQYAQHFAVIRDFNSSLDSKINAPLQELIGKGIPSTLPEMMNRRADLAAMRTISTTLRTSIEGEQAKADAARAALKQPDDLKAVYDKAYARTVTQPAEVVKEIMPAVEGVLITAEKLTTYLDQHKDALTINGPMVAISDPKVLAEANVMMEELSAKSREINAAQRKMVALMTGK